MLCYERKKVFTCICEGFKFYIDIKFANNGYLVIKSQNIALKQGKKNMLTNKPAYKKRNFQDGLQTDISQEGMVN